MMHGPTHIKFYLEIVSFKIWLDLGYSVPDFIFISFVNSGVLTYAILARPKTKMNTYAPQNETNNIIWIRFVQAIKYQLLLKGKFLTMYGKNSDVNLRSYIKAVYRKCKTITFETIFLNWIELKG